MKTIHIQKFDSIKIPLKIPHKLIHVATNGIPKFLFFTSLLILDINHFLNLPNLIEKHISLFDLYICNTY